MEKILLLSEKNNPLSPTYRNLKPISLPNHRKQILPSLLFIAAALNTAGVVARCCMISLSILTFQKAKLPIYSYVHKAPLPITTPYITLLPSSKLKDNHSP